MTRTAMAHETKTAKASKLFQHQTNEQLRRAFQDAMRDMADRRPRTLAAMHEEVTWYHKLRDEMQRRGIRP